MALEQIIAVAALAAGASVTVAHDISDGSGPLKPNYVMPDRPTTIGVTAVDATSITFTNAGAAADTVNFSVRRNHSLVGGTTEMFWSSTSKLIDLEYWKNNRALWGLLHDAPTTPSTQGSGAVAAAWRVNRKAGAAIFKGRGYLTSVDVTDQLVVDVGGSGPPVLEVGQSVVALYILTASKTTGNPTRYYIFGTPNTTGASQPPSDATIRAALLAAYNETARTANPLGDYVRLSQLTLARGGDTAVGAALDDYSVRDY